MVASFEKSIFELYKHATPSSEEPPEQVAEPLFEYLKLSPIMFAFLLKVIMLTW